MFRQFFERESSTYTYLLAAGPERPMASVREAILIDPVREDAEKYLQFLREHKLTLRYAIDTHVHADHVTALGALRDATGCQTVMGVQSKSECVSLRAEDNQVFQIEGVELRAIYTPGHTDDSYSFVAGGRVFTGDTLLIRGTGRTDFQNGNPSDQYDSLFQKLLTLPADTLVYPGHDYRGFTMSTIAEEIAFNPRLQVQGKEEYVALMKALKLANPKQMDVAVPANLACGRI